MKDLIISKEKIIKEIIVWLFCVLAAFLVNVYAIIKYEAGWSELFSQLHIVIILSIPFYLLTWMIRLLLRTIDRIRKSTRV